jgi:ABC-type multidrug transport system ATPase subunit
MSLIRAENSTKSYVIVRAVNSVNSKVEENSITSLTVPNGAENALQIVASQREEEKP